jgi:hypothetical protein
MQNEIQNAFLALTTIAARIRAICSPSPRRDFISSACPRPRARQILNQYTDSRASRNEISTYLEKSRLEDPALASSRLAPTAVPDFSNWSTRHRIPGRCSRFRATRATRQPNSKVRSRISWDRSAMHLRGARVTPRQKRAVSDERDREGGHVYAERAALNCVPHSAFCILHFELQLSYGLAGSISTAIPLHFPCRKRRTLSVARVA